MPPRNLSFDRIDLRQLRYWSSLCACASHQLLRGELDVHLAPFTRGFEYRSRRASASACPSKAISTTCFAFAASSSLLKYSCRQSSNVANIGTSGGVRPSSRTGGEPTIDQGAGRLVPRSAARCPRRALISWVRWRTRQVARTMHDQHRLLFLALDRYEAMEGRVAASQMAAASAASFFPRLS